MYFEIRENECGFMLKRSKLVKTDKIVKSQYVDFLLEKSKFDFDLKDEKTNLPFD